jgi:glycosyltransferase involved in cell wall biosynthesis
LVFEVCEEVKDQNLPLVSVAVITYNQKQLLQECIESILLQDYPNFEIVIGDDGSTDGTQEMLMEYAKNYPEKFVLKLSKKNLGITKNSNNVHFACQGKYIAWIGGDDLMIPGKIYEQVKVMEGDENIVLCHHDVEAFSHNTNRTVWFRKQRYITENLCARDLIKYGNQLISCEVMVRRDAVPAEGFNESFRFVSDYIFNLGVVLSHPKAKMFYIDKVLARYRVHEKSITQDPVKRKVVLLDSLNGFNWLIVYYPEYIKEARCHYSALLRGMRKSHGNRKYSSFLRLSLDIHFTWRSFFGLIVNYCSFGKVFL